MKGSGHAAYRIRSEMAGITEAPGKTWFFELEAGVIDAGRCIQCGACVAACPTDSIGVGEADLPILVKMCTGCALCWDFCPRGGLRYEATWLPSADAAAETFITGAAPAPGLGAVLDAYGARVRRASRLASAGAQDGGVVSALLIALLEAGEIDGAVVAVEDDKQPWKGVAHVATTVEEIAASAGSFYNQTLALGALDLKAVGLDADARVALVGTPCEVEALRALQARPYRRGRSQVDSVVLTIALLCTKSFDYRRLMLDALATEREVDLAKVGKVDVIHGRMIVEDRDGARIVDEPVKRFHPAALKGCDECADFLGRAADLSIGSVGAADGWSSVLVRTPVGRKAFELTADELEVVPLESPEALERLDRLDKRIAGESLRRPLDPNGPLFIDFADHVRAYSDSDRAPQWRDR